VSPRVKNTHACPIDCLNALHLYPFVLADEQSFPPWYHSLPEKERATISFFLAFYSGAYRIYAGDHTLSEARALALAINGETTALPEEEHGR